MRAEWLARMDVRHVQLDDRHGEHRERIAQAVAVVSPGAGVDQHGVDVLAERTMDPFAHLAFVVGLKAFDLRAELLAEREQPGVDFRERGRAVLRRLALAEHVEVDAVEHEDLHRTSLQALSRAEAKIASIVRSVASASSIGHAGTSAPSTRREKRSICSAY